MSADAWTFEALGIIVCLGASAFFSGSETALTSLGRAQTRRLMDERESAHRALLVWAERPNEVLVAILIWNNIVNITASALATQLSEKVLGAVAGGSAFVSPVAVAVGVMTLLLLTFGEITPKTLAKANAERVAPAVMTALRPFMWVSWPVTRAFVALSVVVARWTNSPIEQDAALVSDEDIEFLVRLARKEGTLDVERERLLRSVFDFTETATREVMVPRTDVVFVHVDTPVHELRELVLSAGHSRYPVIEDSSDHVLGVWYARDLLHQVPRSPDDHASLPYLLRTHIRPSKYVPETKPISQLMHEMQMERVHIAIVVDEFGGVSGIVTLEDIIEQFFGDILDEFDKEEPWLNPQPDGSLRIDARINLDDLADALEVEIQTTEEYDTLGGYIAKITGEVAERGAKVDGWGFVFTVIDADERRIRLVHAARAADQEGPEGATEVADAASA